MIRAIILVVVAFFLLIIQSTLAQLLPWDLFVPSLALPIVLYMGLHDYHLGEGAVVSFCVGYLMDVFAGTPIGLYTFATVAAFVISRVAALRLFLQGLIFEIALTFALTVLSSFLILLVRAVFETDFGGLLIYAEIVTSRAAATALIAPLIFRIVARIEEIAPRRRGAEGRMVRS